MVPPSGYKEDEVFKVSLQHYAEPEGKVWMTSYIRQSRYSKFESCVDKSVDARLCACVNEQTAEAEKRGDTAENSVPRKMFGANTVSKDLDSGCLLFRKRSYGSTALAVEVTNVCENRTYKFKMDAVGKEVLLSKKLSVDVELSPKTFYFLTSTMKHDPGSTAELNFTASIQVKHATSVHFVNLGECDVL